MNLAIKLNDAERIRRAIAAEPDLTEADLKHRLGVTSGQIKAALQYRGVQKTGRRSR
ncbi:hypothetical protein [Devosia sp. Root635]|uniref:hypothetical protein n=1 Tax=Devosia sp. Root635 TaxID=1736575 RepID=UPI000A972A4A|nr:hypothetical protein [Devosia sp. Root635]